MNSKFILTFAVLAVAICGASCTVLMADDADAADTRTFNWTVGSAVNDGVGWGDTWTGSVPGVSFSTDETGGRTFVKATGTPTTAGTYTIRTYEGSTLGTTATITVDSGVTYIPVTINASTGGSVNISSLSVPSGTAYRTIGDYMRVGSTVITPTANSGYAFSHWSSSSGTITSATTLTAYFEVYVPPTTYTVTLNGSVGGSAYIQNTTAGTTSSTVTGTGYVTLSASAGDTIVFRATPSDNYVFSAWQNIQTETDISDDNPWTITMPSSDFAVGAAFTSSSTVSIVLNGSVGGSAYIENVTAGTTSETVTGVGYVTLSVEAGDTIRFYATPSEGYVFRAWENIQTETTIYADNPWELIAPSSAMAIGVAFDPRGTWWTNDNYNGKIDIILDFEGTGSQEINGGLFTGSSSAGVANWTPTGYAINVIVEKSGTQTRVGAQLLQGSEVIKSNATGGSWPNVGSWDALQVSIDPEHAQIVFTPVSVLNSFTDYKLYTTQARTMLSWGEVLESSAIRTLQHEASGDAPRFSVVGTRVFLDTYNAVLFDPRINVREKFPQYDSVRLNFYSFALYGDSMTVNGYTYPVTGDKITITYVDKDGTHYAVGVVEGGEQRTRDFTLSNIYVSWDALTGHCTLTFVGDRWTLDLGEYTHQVVSFAGMWYFYTMLYNAHLTQDKSLGDWKTLPETDQSQMVLIYLGILAVAGTAGLIHIRRGGHATLDLIVIGCAGVVGYILLG